MDSPRTTSSAPAVPPASRPPRMGWGSRDISLIAVFAALMAASIAVPPIPAGNVLGVPITIQTAVVTLAGLVLGAGRGAAAMGLYVLVGLAGLPIFSAFRGGLGVLAGGSAGYILSFPLAALVVGLLAQLVLRRNLRRRGIWLFAATFGGLATTHLLGIGGMMVNGQLALPAALAADLPFIPGDILKNALAVLVALSVHRAFPDVLVRRTR
ncbi:biotin transporter BioY [Arthrobacter sp. I2-34]|uniref:Biotin transporter n=1 Tax=Arthrobacter hankyongi TaxID=2904801 RepID=A0ABS9L6D8_9MICC|nr:biotin transporter BioY [Arthrobacter hankyongi]MCG2622083.1 biotin transporter BioY [Arthrobacter hankyongi]